MRNYTFSAFTSCLLAILFLFSSNATAHAPDHSYLYFRIYKEAIGGRVELTAKDMNSALGLQLDKRLSLEAIQPHLSAIQNYLLERVRISSKEEGEYKIRFTEPTVLNLEEMDDFVRFHFDLDGVKKVPESLDIDYNVVFDQNPKHQGVLIVEYNWKAGIVDNESLITHVFSPGNTKQNLSLTDASLMKGLMAMIRLGVWHIWIGLDHILFILALILPAVVRRKDEDESLAAHFDPDYSDTWIPVPRFYAAFMYIIKVITFFTIAHSITLAMASLGVVDLPSSLVESIIAISIALAAYHNIRPIFKGKEWWIAFGFGLFHGFGFASVLGEKGLSGDFMVLSLLGFNIGVEVGQVLIICMIFPVLFLIRKMRIYPKIIYYGSILLIIISIYWFIERGFDVDLPAGAWFWKAYHAVLG